MKTFHRAGRPPVADGLVVHELEEQRIGPTNASRCSGSAPRPGAYRGSPPRRGRPLRCAGDQVPRRARPRRPRSRRARRGDLCSVSPTRCASRSIMTFPSRLGMPCPSDRPTTDVERVKGSEGSSTSDEIGVAGRRAVPRAARSPADVFDIAVYGNPEGGRSGAERTPRRSLQHRRVSVGTDPEPEAVALGMRGCVVARQTISSTRFANDAPLETVRTRTRAKSPTVEYAPPVARAADREDAAWFVRRPLSLGGTRSADPGASSERGTPGRHPAGANTRSAVRSWKPSAHCFATSVRTRSRRCKLETAPLRTSPDARSTRRDSRSACNWRCGTRQLVLV